MYVVFHPDNDPIPCIEQEAPSNLRQLIVQDCIKLQRLPESMGKLRQLTSINLHTCTSLKIIPDSFGQLRGLTDLEFDGCHALECLPETFGGLTRLHSLTMRDCCSMVSLPESFGDLRSLSDLTIEGCQAMVSLPESSGKLTQLQFLFIGECNALEGLPQSLRCWTNLVRVWVLACDKIRLSPKQFQGIHSPSSSFYLSVYDDDTEVAHSLFGITDLRNFVQPIQNKQQTCKLSDFELVANHVIQSLSGLPNGGLQLNLGGFCNVQELPQSLCELRHLEILSLNHFYNLQKLPESIGGLSFLENLSLIWCLNLEEVDPIGNLQNLSKLVIDTCLGLKVFPSCIGDLPGLKELSVINCEMMEVIHVQALFSLDSLAVYGCVNLTRIVGLSHLFNLTYLKLEGCLNLREIMVGTPQFNRLHEVDIVGCYRLRDGQLSLKPDDEEDTETFEEEVLEGSLNAMARHPRILNVKMYPALTLVMEQKIKDLIACQDMCCFFHKLQPAHVHTKHVLSLPFIPQTVVICLISFVYTAELPRQVPPPKTGFFWSTGYKHRDQFYGGSTGAYYHFRRFDCGEEIHFAVLPFYSRDIKRCDDDIYVNIKKGRLMTDGYYDYKGINPCHAQSYEAFVKDGWMVYLGFGKEYLAEEIRNIFCSEFRKQRLISWAWTDLPSQLHIYEFSALDIAGCQITKISRHGNTYIMEEKSGLIWSKRRCLFMDDHALLLHHPKDSEHSFLAYPEIDRDIEKVVANLYEMSISILVNGEVVSSRKLQQIIPITEEKIPPHTLLQGRDFYSSSETKRWVKLLRRVKLLLQRRDFYSSSKTNLRLKRTMRKKVKEKTLYYDTSL